MFTLGSPFNRGDIIHPKFHSGELFDHCAVCGRKLGQNTKIIRTDVYGNIAPNASKDEAQIFAVGSECAKKFSEDSFDESGWAEEYR